MLLHPDEGDSPLSIGTKSELIALVVVEKNVSKVRVVIKPHSSHYFCAGQVQNTGSWHEIQPSLRLTHIHSWVNVNVLPIDQNFQPSQLHNCIYSSKIKTLADP